MVTWVYVIGSYFVDLRALFSQCLLYLLVTCKMLHHLLGAIDQATFLLN